MQKLTKLDIVSFSKFHMYIIGIVYGLFGLFVGIFSIIEGSIVMGLLTIVGSVLGGAIAGFIIGAVQAFLINIVLKLSGGIKLKLELGN